VSPRQNPWVRLCLALVYHKLDRQADAAAEMENYQAALGDAAAYQYASVYAQWGDVPKALEWLDKACARVTRGSNP
jgi:hypothetical protein